MLYEFAITPDVFDVTSLNEDKSLHIILVQVLRGLIENGLFANLHNEQLVPFIQHSLQVLQPGLRKDITLYLNLLKDYHRLVFHPPRQAGKPTCDEDWLDAAMISHYQRKFHGIIISQGLYDQSGINEPELVALPDILNTEDIWLNRHYSFRLQKCEADYRKHLAPVLHYARKVDLIDPYVSCHDPDCMKTVEICAELFNQVGQTQGKQNRGKICIHAGDPRKDSNHNEPPQARLQAWKRQLQPLVNDYGHTFQICLWGNQQQHLMHDRYILTNQWCGINSSHSFDCRTSNAGYVTWSLLEKEVYQELARIYAPRANYLRSLGTMNVS